MKRKKKQNKIIRQELIDREVHDNRAGLRRKLARAVESELFIIIHLQKTFVFVGMFDSFLDRFHDIVHVNDSILYMKHDLDFFFFYTYYSYLYIYYLPICLINN